MNLKKKKKLIESTDDEFETMNYVFADVVGGRGGGLERNQGPSQAQRGGYRPNTRYGAPPIQNIQNGNQNEDRPQLQRQAVNH